MNKFLAAVVVLVAAVATVVFFYFKSLNSSRYQSQPFKAVPSSAALVLDFRNSEEFLSLFQKNKMLDDLFSASLTTDVKLLNSSFLQHADLRNVLKDERILASLHINKAHAPALLFIIPLKNADKLDRFFNNLKEEDNTLKYRVSKIEDAQVYTVELSDKNKAFSFTSYKGLLLGSFDPELLKNSIEVQRNSTDISLSSLIKVENIETSAIKATMYINYKQLGLLTDAYLNEKNQGGLAFLAGIAKWSTLNLNYKNDALMFNGITNADLSSADYLAMFLNQKPQPVRIPSLLADRTSFFVDFGISDYTQFKKDHKVLLGQSKRTEVYEKWIASFNKNYSMDLEAEWPMFMGNEFALALYDTQGTNPKSNQIAIIALSDTTKAKDFLRKIVAVDKRKGVSRGNLTDYKGFPMFYCGYPDLLSSALGAVYKNIEWPYITVVNQYLVAASHQPVLQQFIDDLLLKENLERSVNYQQYKQYINTESNVYFYLNFANSNTIVADNGNKRLVDYSGEKHGIANYYGLTFQLNSSGGQFFSNLNFLYQPKALQNQVKDTTSYALVKSVDLDADVNVNPVLIDNGNGTHAYVVADTQSRLYYLDGTGRLLWKVKLTEPLMGSVNTIKIEGRPYMVFNTTSKVFVVDENGKSYRKFPLSFKRKITAPISVFDYESNGEYRLVVPLADKSVSIFDLDANRVDGWRPKQNVGLVTHPVQQAKVSGITFLYTITDKNKFSFFDRKGKQLASGKLPVIVNNQFYPVIGTRATDSRFVSADTAGNIVTVFFDGRVRTKNLGTWSGEQFFALKNITGDATPEYVYFDKNHLYVYNNNGSLVYDYVPDGETSPQIQFFEDGTGKNLIGLHLTIADQLIILNENGEVASGFPVKGNTSFVKYYSATDRTEYLVTGASSNKLLIYRKK